MLNCKSNLSNLHSLLVAERYSFKMTKHASVSSPLECAPPSHWSGRQPRWVYPAQRTEQCCAELQPCPRLHASGVQCLRSGHVLWPAAAHEAAALLPGSSTAHSPSPAWASIHLSGPNQYNSTYLVHKDQDFQENIYGCSLFPHNISRCAYRWDHFDEPIGKVIAQTVILWFIREWFNIDTILITLSSLMLSLSCIISLLQRKLFSLRVY